VCSDAWIQQQSRRATTRIHLWLAASTLPDLPDPIGFVLFSPPSLSPQIRNLIQTP
jgi:hypothetical protein